MTRAGSVAWRGMRGAPQVMGKVGIKGDGIGRGWERDVRFIPLQTHPCTRAGTDLLSRSTWLLLKVHFTWWEHSAPGGKRMMDAAFRDYRENAKPNSLATSGRE